ncbi:MAG: NUDIX domain-containing protein [Candidatus Omnitrophica bacterium]|nr:NUDIX domain-containing protein [Candidatus Omnitrophota bacterium]
MIRNIIFDWSGTLVDDLPAVWQASNEAFVKAGVPEITLAQFQEEFCLPFKDFYERFVPHVPLPQLEQWFHASFRRITDSVRAIRHAREFLEFCQSRGLRMFVLSTVRSEYFHPQAAAVGFASFFEQAYLEVRDKRKKILELLDQDHLIPGETLFIGDMQHDIETAKCGRIHSCAVLTGYNGLAQLRASKPDLIVEHLGELREILENNGLEIRPQPSPARRGKALHPIVTVGALIFNQDDQVLMVRTAKWSNRWGIPGGKIQFGETAEEALRREIKEETNLDIDSVRFVLAQDCIRSPEFYREAHFVLLNYWCRCRGEPRVILNSEAREFRWVRPEEARRLPLNQPTINLLAAVEKEVNV